MAQSWSDPGRDIIGEVRETFWREYERWLYSPDHPLGPRSIYAGDYAHPRYPSDHKPERADETYRVKGYDIPVALLDEAESWGRSHSWTSDPIAQAGTECPSDFLPELSRTVRRPHALERALLADRHAVYRWRFGE